jgi:spermidine synthase
VDAATAAPNRPLPEWLAVVLVAGTSAAVLVVEILAARLLAPYVGATLETYTAIIGTILAGIALGAWLGGWGADHVAPRRLLAPLLGFGGALVIASVPIVRTLGRAAGTAGGGGLSIVLAGVAFLPPAAVLSAIPPVVVKLQLRDLTRTGSTVGRLSAWSTGGAIAGTFLAGFVLVAYAAVTTLVVTVGAVLVAGAVVAWSATRPREVNVAGTVASITVLAVAGVTWIDSTCDTQTTYYCVSIRHDPDRPTGRVLVLDDLRHSYVDVADPTHLEFWYVRRIADAIDVAAPAGPLDVVSIGGGGFTLPTWLRATRPGSEQVVLELDGELVDLVERELGVDTGGDVDVRIGDARRSLRALDDSSADVVVGDAFGSRSIPWHLATVELVRDVTRVLRPDGIYVVNVIDGADEDLLRAVTRTIAEVLPHVAVMRSDALVDGASSGNAVVLASESPLDARAWDAARAAHGDDGELVADVDEYVDGAVRLTDDFAPVDQLILGTR